MSYTTPATLGAIAKTIEHLEKNGVHTIQVEDETAALLKIKELIPASASVMNGSSTTLEQIGFIEYLKSGTHGWNNLHESIVNEKDLVKQKALRKQALLADFYLGSVHALSETGEFIIASNSGSQLPHVVFSSPNLIFVVGIQKIVPSLADGFKRLEEYVIPLEDERSKKKYGAGTYPSKIVLFKRENAHSGRTVRIILVHKNLGF